MRRDRLSEEAAFEVMANELQEHLEATRDEHTGDHWCSGGHIWHNAQVIPRCPELELAALHLEIMETHFGYYGNMPDGCLPVPVITMLGKFYGV